MGSGRGSKHGEKSFDIILGIGIPYLLMNLMSCHGFLKNINTVVVLKCPKRILQYYFSKWFNILQCNYNNLEKLPNDVKQRTHAEETYDSEKFMTCINTITSTSNTLKNLVVNKILNASYIQTEFNDKKKIIINIFSAYVVPLLNISTILHWFKNGNFIFMLKSMKEILMLTFLNLPIKNKLIVMIATCTGLNK